jgi:hypothetical protein
MVSFQFPTAHSKQTAEGARDAMRMTLAECSVFPRCVSYNDKDENIGCGYNLRTVIVQLLEANYIKYSCPFCDADVSHLVKSQYVSVDLTPLPQVRRYLEDGQQTLGQERQGDQEGSDRPSA